MDNISYQIHMLIVAALLASIQPLVQNPCTFVSFVKTFIVLCS